MAVARRGDGTGRGLYVYAGYILGFDSDTPDIFAQMITCIEESAVAIAMVGQLSALPRTPLYERLQKEGRLRPVVPGDQFGRANIITKIPASTMLQGYRHVLQSLSAPEAYCRRCTLNVAL